MNCKIECGVPTLNPLPLKKLGTSTEKKAKWFTNDKGVTYCLDIPGGIFKECQGTGSCEFQVKFGQNVELHLEASAKVGKRGYGVRVCGGALPGTCKQQPLTPPEIIVSDDKDKKKTKPAAVKKAAPKKKSK